MKTPFASCNSSLPRRPIQGTRKPDAGRRIAQCPRANTPTNCVVVRPHTRPPPPPPSHRFASAHTPLEKTSSSTPEQPSCLDGPKPPIPVPQTLPVFGLVPLKLAPHHPAQTEPSESNFTEGRVDNCCVKMCKRAESGGTCSNLGPRHHQASEEPFIYRTPFNNFFPLANLVAAIQTTRCKHVAGVSRRSETLVANLLRVSKTMDATVFANLLHVCITLDAANVLQTWCGRPFGSPTNPECKLVAGVVRLMCLTRFVMFLADMSVLCLKHCFVGWEQKSQAELLLRRVSTKSTAHPLNMLGKDILEHAHEQMHAHDVQEALTFRGPADSLTSCAVRFSMSLIVSFCFLFFLDIFDFFCCFDPFFLIFSSFCFFFIFDLFIVLFLFCVLICFSFFHIFLRFFYLFLYFLKKFFTSGQVKGNAQTGRYSRAAPTLDAHIGPT